jgi:4-hydroxybenzoate polyprenyltransferase
MDYGQITSLGGTGLSLNAENPALPPHGFADVMFLCEIRQLRVRRDQAICTAVMMPGLTFTSILVTMVCVSTGSEFPAIISSSWPHR